MKLENKKMYYHEYYMKYNSQPYRKGKINLVRTPCGSGKTYHCNQLIEQYDNTKKDIYYVTDTRMLRESVKKDLPSHVKVITYQALGMILSNENQMMKFLYHTELLMLDEIHQLFRYARRFNDEKICSEDKMFYKVAIIWLYNLPIYMKVLALSGTPGELLDHAERENQIDVIHDVVPKEIRSMLHQQQVGEIVQVVNVGKWLENEFELSEGEQALGFANTIDILITYKNILESKGYRVGVLWSKNATGKTKNDNEKAFTDEQEQLYVYIKENSKLPSDIDILLVNAAYESGWNLENNGCNKIQTVFINSSDNVTITQITNRVRHDIKLCVSSEPIPTTSDFYDENWIMKQYRRVNNIINNYWQDSYLFTKQDKDKFCDDLRILDKHRRIVRNHKKIVDYIYKIYAYYWYSKYKNSDEPFIPFKEFIKQNEYDLIPIHDIDVVTFYDNKVRKTIKNVWQIRHKTTGVNLGDKRSLFEKIQYFKRFNFTEQMVADKLNIDIQLVIDNWIQPYKVSRTYACKQQQHKKSESTRLKVQELKAKGLIQKQVASQLNIGLATVKRNWK